MNLIGVLSKFKLIQVLPDYILTHVILKIDRVRI